MSNNRNDIKTRLDILVGQSSPTPEGINVHKCDKQLISNTPENVIKYNELNNECKIPTDQTSTYDTIKTQFNQCGWNNNIAGCNNTTPVSELINVKVTDKNSLIKYLLCKLNACTNPLAPPNISNSHSIWDNFKHNINLNNYNKTVYALSFIPSLYLVLLILSRNMVYSGILNNIFTKNTVASRNRLMMLGFFLMSCYVVWSFINLPKGNSEKYSPTETFNPYIYGIVSIVLCFGLAILIGIIQTMDIDNYISIALYLFIIIFILTGFGIIIGSFEKVKSDERKAQATHDFYEGKYYKDTIGDRLKGAVFTFIILMLIISIFLFMKTGDWTTKIILTTFLIFYLLYQAFMSAFTLLFPSIMIPLMVLGRIIGAMTALWRSTSSSGIVSEIQQYLVGTNNWNFPLSTLFYSAMKLISGNLNINLNSIVDGSGISNTNLFLNYIR